MKLYLDYETRCALDLRKVGAYRYVADKSCRILLLAYAVNDGPIVTLFWNECDGWSEFDRLLQSASQIIAHNVGFDRLVTDALLNRAFIPYDRWHCTAARARAAGLPSPLGDAARALGLPYQKDARGKALIKRYSMPQKDGSFREPTPEDRDAWRAYAARDVELLRQLDHRLPELLPYERRLFVYDMQLNDRGIGVDLGLLEACRDVAAKVSREVNAELAVLSDNLVTTAAQGARLLRSLTDHGAALPDLTRQTVGTALAAAETPATARAILAQRAEGSRTSTAKLEAMHQRQVDGRLHGTLLYYGAHTGRHSSIGVQLQNLPRPERDWWQIEQGFVDLYRGDLSQLRILYGSPAGLVADALRSLLVPRAGHVFEVCDLNAVELRGAAWLAGERFVLDALAAGEDVYCRTASSIFSRVITPGDERERFLGKTIELAGQYGMGAVKFVKVCAAQGVDVDEMFAHRSVAVYRETHPRIVNAWYGIERAVTGAVVHPGAVETWGPLQFTIVRGWLRMRLPSGRFIAYYDPRYSRDEGLAYAGVNSVTHQFTTQRLWGSMLFEHAVQGLCRDLLMEGCFRLEEMQHPVQLLVHDECVTEVAEAAADIRLVEQLLTQAPAWAPALPLAAKGRVVDRYRKI